MPAPGMSVQSESYTDTCTALAVALLANVPVILWGPPGQGKTAVIEKFASDMQLHIETIIAAIREPTDFNGLPVVDVNTGSVRLAPPQWAKNLADAKGGQSLCFLDEISTAPPATQAGLLRFVHDRVCGELVMPSAMRVVAAANPPDIAADGWDLAPPMANRFLHLNWSLPADVVRDGFSFGWPSIPMPRLAESKTIAKHLNDTKVLIGSFIAARPEMRTVMPTSSEEAGRAFPTPRSWEQVAKLYATAKSVLGQINSNVIRLLVTGSVGQAAATELLTFIEQMDLPDPEKLLADPTTFKVPSQRADKVYAISASIVSALLSNVTPERWQACGDVLARIAEAGHGDIAFNAGRHWAQARPGSTMPVERSLKHLLPIMSELNLVF